MSKDESGIVRSQYSNFLGSDSVIHENSEKSDKKHDQQVESVIKKLQRNQDLQKRKDYTYMAEQDAEPGYDMLNGVISNPSNIDLVDGLVDSDEEIRTLGSNKESHSPNHPMNSGNKRTSVLEALEKKKEIVQQREKERQLQNLERDPSKDAAYAR